MHIEPRQRTQSKKSRFYIVPLMLLLFLSSVVFWFVYPFPSNIKTDYFQSPDPIIWKEAVFEGQALVKDDELYFPFSFVTEHIDSNIVYDQDSTSVVVTTKDRVYQMPTNQLTYQMNQEEYSLSFPAFVEEGNAIYVSTEWMEDIYPILIKHSKDTGAIHVLEEGETFVKGQAVETFDEDLFRIRTRPTITSAYVSTLETNEEVTIVEEDNQYVKIRQENGIAGYVKKEVIELNGTEQIEKTDKRQVTPFYPPKMEWPIHITWDAIYSPQGTPKTLASYEGVQIISPTWFHLQDGEGTIRSYASKEYMKAADEKNYQVWALFSNDFQPERTHEALQTFETRQKMINQLVHYASIYGFQGINVDFENVFLEDGPLLTQFMRELTPLAHEAGLVVSIDITFISSNEQYSMFLEREKLATIVDYMMVMAYDEHWAASPKAGSVASLPWVESNLTRLLEVVPHDQLLLGVPLYTRLWTETKLEDGTIDVTSESLTMDEVGLLIEEHKLEPRYDDNTGQEYVEWSDEEKDITYKIWIENSQSLQKRIELVHKYRLAGLASWSDYFASELVWNEMNDSLRTKNVLQQEEN
ncbi:spore germination protein YaaH [Salirhabdus euzebyi]|uniref:Spore germination protein YaaH n=1 Tax=Salirhabdus euzebyi TaxID=394506 RepID=A0A841Q372_9BACI|nr:glycosyl hydrolase family 18 protein [Salirhabdus euzebyi]MBB6452798.1 spore germination protein YaaH [Salirhabdus euzebyi]